MRKFLRKSENVEVDLTDGSIKKITLSELSNEGAQEWKELMVRFLVDLQSYYAKHAELMSKVSAETESMEIEKFAEEMKNLDSTKGVIDGSGRMWKIMTGEEDITWVAQLYPSISQEITALFLEINKAGFESLKKTEDQRSILDQISVNLETAGDVKKLLNS